MENINAFNVEPVGLVSKYELRQGIETWVAEKLHRDRVYLASLERVNWDELILIAAAMGYRPRNAGERRAMAATITAHQVDKPLIEGGS